MPHLVVGTAGHIDHGKSALVLALTGKDPDRLKEEKRRGITIELGFADLELGPEQVISFIDVPGHERFVRHMVAGATGIDAVLLVVAADQGIQPQTREHLDICSLLGVERGIVVLTKCDLVDDELQQVARMELEELLQGTFLQSAPLVHVSAERGDGLHALREELGRLLEANPQRPAEGVARLPVDRSFVLKGFGTVVTGTLISGRFVEGEEVEVLPGGRRARIRGLQVHGHDLAATSAGRRVAVNLQGVDCAEVPRGSTVCRPGEMALSRRAWARLKLLPSAPRRLERGGRVRVHQGTTDVAARLRILGDDGAGTHHAEFVFEAPMVLAVGDRYIVRRPAPVDTMGGGVFVDAFPPRGLRATAPAFAAEMLEPAAAIRLRLHRAGPGGCEPARLCRELGRTSTEIESAFEALRAAASAIRAGAIWVDANAWNATAVRVQELLAAFHASEPLRPGLSREALRGEVAPSMAQEVWRERLESLRDSGEIRLEGERAALSCHRIELSAGETALAREIEDQVLRAGWEPPDPQDLAQASRPILDLLLAQGRLVRLEDGRLIHVESLERLKQLLRDHARSSPTIDVAVFKELTGVTRKHAIPLLEHLDASRVTRRIGNSRQILLRDPE